MDGPKLIDGNVFQNIQHTLRMCHENRVQFYSKALNLIVLVMFVTIVFLTLYYSYRKKPTKFEQHQQMMEDQKYVLSKIRYYREQQKNILTSPIGNL
jgi:hypothetical protein